MSVTVRSTQYIYILYYWIHPTKTQLLVLYSNFLFSAETTQSELNTPSVGLLQVSEFIISHIFSHDFHSIPEGLRVGMGLYV